MSGLDRSTIFPEPELPDAGELLAAGRLCAEAINTVTCPFLTTYGVESETVYKRQRMGEGGLMFHAQFGFRNFDNYRLRLLLRCGTTWKTRPAPSMRRRHPRSAA